MRQIDFGVELPDDPDFDPRLVQTEKRSFSIEQIGERVGGNTRPGDSNMKPVLDAKTGRQGTSTPKAQSEGQKSMHIDNKVT